MKTILAFALALTACISGSVSEPNICKSTSIDFPVPSGISVGESIPLSYSTQVDYSDTLSKFSDVGDVQIGIESDRMTSISFDWLQSLSITAQDAAGKMTPITIAQYSGGQSGSSITLTSGSTDGLFAYFAQGPVVITFAGMASSTPSAITNNLCLSATVSKSLGL